MVPIASKVTQHKRMKREKAIICTHTGTDLLSEDGESIGCPDEFLGEDWVIGGMASVVNNHQLGTWPHTFEFPGVDNGGLKVKATIYQDSRDAGQGISVAQ